MAHDGQRPHAGMKLRTTWSPGASSVTPGPDLDHLAGPLVAADDRELLQPEELRDRRGP